MPAGSSARKPTPGRKRAATRTSARSSAKTRWGDREGRRRDILDAARAQMENGGYLALNMRDLAGGAGVSPGTLYSYFATKEEIFATLYAEAIEAHNERIAPICEQATRLEPLLVELGIAYLDLYGAYGRYFTLWSALVAEGPADEGGEVLHSLPRELARSLRSATFRQGDLVRGAIQRAATAEGAELVDEPMITTLLWTVFNGVGDHVFSDRRHLSGFGPDELVHYAARTIAKGICR